MQHRARRQAFRPHWLAVALQALGLHVDANARPLALSIELPEGRLALSVSSTGVEIANSEQWEPDVRLRGVATNILGLAAGDLDWNAAVRGGLEVQGSRAAIAVLRASMSNALRE
jgi:ubiquinone biosynthesis protein UbiJ